MKRIFALLATAAVAMAAMSCTDDKKDDVGVVPPPVVPPTIEEKLFAVEVSEITTSTAKITVTPSDKVTTTWYWDLTEASDTVNEEFIEVYLNSYFEYVVNSGSVPADLEYSEFLSTIIFAKDKTDSFVYERLNPDTEYVIWVAGMDAEGNILTDIETTNFKTQAVVQSDMTFDISVSGSVISITPSNNDPYTWFYGTQSDVDVFGSVEGLLSYMVQLCQTNGINFTYTGPIRSDESQYLQNGTNYVWAVGYDGGFTTQIYEYAFEFSGATAPDEPTCTLTGNVDTVLDTVYGAANYGADIEPGTTYFYLDLMNSAGEDIMLALLADADAVSPVGTYTLAADRYAPWTAVPGVINDRGNFAASWYLTVNADGYIVEPYGALESGTITVSDDPKGYKVEVDAVSGNYTVKAVFVGAIDIENAQAAPSPKHALRRNVNGNIAAIKSKMLGGA